MSDLLKYKAVIVTNGENRVATMRPDTNGRWLFDDDVEERIAELEQSIIKAVDQEEIDADRIEELEEQVKGLTEQKEAQNAMLRRMTSVSPNPKKL